MAAYVSLRFMAPTRATLGLARWPLSCSVEVAALRGTSGAEPLIHRLERVTRLRGGTVHWGQRNGLDPRAVRDTLGPDLDRWHAAVRQLDPHFVFSNPFSIDHGLDPPPGVSWRDWNDLRQLGLHEAVIPSGAGTQVEILARGDDGRLESLTLDNMAQPVGSWTQVRPESGLYPPVVVAGPAGRLDLFELNDSGWLRHTWRDPSDMLWREYNVKGWPGPGDFSTDLPRLSATAHGDGRIEIFGRAALRHSHWLGHTWAHAREGWWTTVHYRPDASLGQPPAAAARRQAGREVLVVAGVTHDQSLVTRHQLHGADDADWSDWAAVPAHELPGAPASAPVLVAPQDQELRLFYIDVLGRVVMGVDVGDQLHPVWSFTTVATQTALSPALTTIAHAGRTWLAARSQQGELVCWDFAAGQTGALGRYLDAATSVPAAIGGIPGTPAVAIVARREDGWLAARRVEPSGP